MVGLVNILSGLHVFTIGQNSSNMAWRCTGRTNAELISNLAASGLIKNDRVLRAMSGVCSRLVGTPSRSPANLVRRLTARITVPTPPPHTKIRLNPSATAPPSLLRICTPQPANHSCPSSTPPLESSTSAPARATSPTSSPTSSRAPLTQTASNRAAK